MGKTGASVEILLYALCNTLSEIAKVDGRVKRIIDGRDTEIQFKVQPDGPSAYLQIEKGRIIFYRGDYNPLNPPLIRGTTTPLPSFTKGGKSGIFIVFSSAENAYNFLLRKSVLPILGILIKNIRHPVLLFQTLRLLLFAGEYLSPSKGIVSAGS